MKSNSLQTFLNQYYLDEKLNHIIKNNDKYYSSFNIYKGDLNKKRRINAPKGDLKIFQKKFAKLILEQKRKNYFSHGYELSKSIKSNARNHVGKKLIIKLDLKDFFQKIDTIKVANCLKDNFLLSNNKSIYFSLLTTYNNSLPQGSPSSPIISNYCLYEMDYEINNFLFKGIVYTRYADDLTFSTNYNINYQSMIKSIRKIIYNHGMEINNNKIHILPRNKSQKVTGIVVNDKVNIDRKQIKLIRSILYNILQNGYKHEREKFYKEFNNSNLIGTLEGWVNYIGFIRGKKDKTYIKFKRQIYSIKENSNIL